MNVADRGEGDALYMFNSLLLLSGHVFSFVEEYLVDYSDPSFV